MIEGLTDLLHQAANQLVGPHAVVPWWSVVAWLLVVFVSILAPGIKAKLTEDENEEKKRD